MSAGAPSRSRTPLAMRDIVLMVVMGVVFGFLYWALVQAWNGLAVLMGGAGDLAQHVLLGGWLMVAPITLAILRRPGTGLAAEVLATVVEVVFLGSPVGPLLLVSAVLQGAGSELGFAVLRYRRWGWAPFALSGVLGAGLVFFWSAFRFQWYEQDILLLRLGIQLLSGLLLGGLLAKVVVDRLLATGVLANFPIARATRGEAPAQRRGR